MSDEVDADLPPVRTSPMFVTRTLVLEPGTRLIYEPAAWDDAIVFVTAGEIELECASGTTQRFPCGATLCLQRLHLRAVRNSGGVVACLVTVRRRASWGAELIG